MKTRWKILIGAGIFLVLAMASAWMTAHHRPQSDVEDYKKLLRAQGEKLTIDELLPAPTPAESNSLPAVEKAFALMGSMRYDIPNTMRMVAPGKAMAGWMQPQACGYDFTNDWEYFSTGVAADAPMFELLRQTLDRPKLDFQLDYKKGAGLLVPHLMKLKQAEQHLDAAAICELHNGNLGMAATNILIMIALAQRNESEGLLISHLVRIAMLSIAVAPTWEFLQATNGTDEQLGVLQRGWERPDFFL